MIVKLAEAPIPEMLQILVTEKLSSGESR